jgi:hypothetical protein
MYSDKGKNNTKLRIQYKQTPNRDENAMPPVGFSPSSFSNRNFAIHFAGVNACSIKGRDFAFEDSSTSLDDCDTITWCMPGPIKKHITPTRSITKHAAHIGEAEDIDHFKWDKNFIHTAAWAPDRDIKTKPLTKFMIRNQCGQ